MQRTAAFATNRKDALAMSDRAAALLQRQRLEVPLLPPVLSSVIDCLLQLVRFVLLQLYVGYWIEHAVLRIRRVADASLHLEMAFWFNRLETLDSYNVERFTQLLKALNHLVLIADDSSSPQTQVIRVAALRILGSVLSQYGWLGRLIGARFTSRAQTYVSRSPDLEKCLIGVGNADSGVDLRSLSKTQCFFDFLGGEFMHKAAVAGISSMSSLLKGNLTAAARKIDEVCAEVPPSPVSRFFVARWHLVTAGALWLSRRYPESANAYLQILSELKREEDCETHIMAAISLTACFIESGPKMLDAASTLIEYLHSPVCATLIAGDAVRHLQVVGLESNLACKQGKYVDALKLWESIQDEVERHAGNQLLLGTSGVGFDVSFECFRNLRREHDPNSVLYSARALALTRRCLTLMRQQRGLGSLFDVSYWYSHGRFLALDPDKRGPGAIAAALKSFSYCKELCARNGPDAYDIAAMCDSISSRLIAAPPARTIPA